MRGFRLPLCEVGKSYTTTKIRQISTNAFSGTMRWFVWKLSWRQSSDICWVLLGLLFCSMSYLMLDFDLSGRAVAVLIGLRSYRSSTPTRTLLRCPRHMDDRSLSGKSSSSSEYSFLNKSNVIVLVR